MQPGRPAVPWQQEPATYHRAGAGQADEPHNGSKKKIADDKQGKKKDKDAPGPGEDKDTTPSDKSVATGRAPARELSTDTPTEGTGEPHKEFVAVKTHPPSTGGPAVPRDTATQDEQGAASGSPNTTHATSGRNDEATAKDTSGRESVTGSTPKESSTPGTRGDEKNESGSRKEAAPISNGKENQVVHTRSVSIKGVLKGQPRTIPLADEEISEDDQVDKAVPPEPERVEVTEDLIRKAWKEYAASIEKSHPRIFSTLIQQEPLLTEKGIIRISLTTQAQRENFIHRIKPELTRYFQKTIADIAYVFETDLIENETTVKKVYTDQDKLDYLINKNPDLEKMKSRFNLDFDD